MGKNHEDSQREVRELFSKLSSWMEKSQRQFSTLINSNNRSITKGVHELVEEVRKLQNELSTVRKEKNILIETVNCLNNEIKRHNERELKKSRAAQENDSIEVITPVPKVNPPKDINQLRNISGLLNLDKVAEN